MGGLAVGVLSEAVAGLARSEHPEHPDLALRVVAAGIGTHLVHCPITAIAGQLPHARMPANRVAAGVLAQPIGRCADRRQPVPCPRP